MQTKPKVTKKILIKSDVSVAPRCVGAAGEKELGQRERATVYRGVLNCAGDLLFNRHLVRSNVFTELFSKTQSCKNVCMLDSACVISNTHQAV